MHEMADIQTRLSNEEPAGFALSDARLVDEARRGNQDAFGQLVQRYERRLQRLIYRFVSDAELSRDLAQEAFLRVYERLDRFDTSRRFGPWLFRIAMNLTTDHLRRQRRWGRWSLFSERFGDQRPEPVVADPRQTLDLTREVSRALEAIPEKYRQVLILREMENFSTSEIAAILGRKEATIRWRLAEGRIRFQKIWAKRLGLTEPPIADGTDSDEM